MYRGPSTGSIADRLDFRFFYFDLIDTDPATQQGEVLLGTIDDSLDKDWEGRTFYQAGQQTPANAPRSYHFEHGYLKVNVTASDASDAYNDVTAWLKKYAKQLSKIYGGTQIDYA
jgi:hypothetical protein